MNSPTETPALPDDAVRLNGWKEIAGHLGKGVRTVQRWEREYGLPIRRVGREGGEIVFAFKHELDTWSLEADQPRDEPTADDSPVVSGGMPAPAVSEVQLPTRHWDWRSTGLAILIALAIAGLGFRGAGLGRSSPPNPTRATVDKQALRVFGADGSQLWAYTLDFLPGGEAYQPTDDWIEGANPVLIEDLDSDGLNEVLFARRPSRRNDRHGLTVLNSDGSTRFTVEPSLTRRFGTTDYAGPWMSYRLFVTRNADGTRTIWAVFVHGMWFPTLLLELDARGNTKSTYWSAGYVESIATAVWRGKPVVLVGGTHNESRGASLAIFEAGKIGGSSPAARDAYQCRDCEGAGPMEFLVFPRLAIARAVDGQATVLEAWVDGADGVHVLAGDGPGVSSTAGAWYTITSSVGLGKVEFTAGTEPFHNRLFREGRIASPFTPEGLADARPQRWDGRSFVEIQPSSRP